MDVVSYSAKHNYNYYIRNAYSKNRSAIKSDYRSSQPNTKIMSADADAVSKMAEKLRSLEYDSDHGVEVLQNAKAFVEAYNNLIDSTGESDNSSIAGLKKQLSKMTKKEKDDLESIGITIKSNGKLSLDKDVFGESRPEKIGRILSSEGTFSNAIRSVAKKISRTSSKMPVYTVKAQKVNQGQESSGQNINISG